MRPGPRNLITDVPGLAVGHADDASLRSGVTVILPDAPARASADLRGGGPGTRETEALGDAGLVNELHALVLSGGSAFGLDAATGVQSFLREKGVGFAIGPVRDRTAGDPVRSAEWRRQELGPASALSRHGV